MCSEGGAVANWAVRSDLWEERALREGSDRGDTDAALDLATLLEDRGEIDEAIAEYRKLDAKGVLNGTGNLARLLKETGDQWTTAQYDAFVMMDDLGDLWANISGDFPILESICDRDAVVAGLHAADAKGSPAAAHELGTYFQGRGDLADASRSFERAAEHGWKSALYEAGVARYQGQGHPWRAGHSQAGRRAGGLWGPFPCGSHPAATEKQPGGHERLD